MAIKKGVFKQLEKPVSHYSEIYNGYTITKSGSSFVIDGFPTADFLSVNAARRFIDLKNHKTFINQLFNACDQDNHSRTS